MTGIIHTFVFCALFLAAGLWIPAKPAPAAQFGAEDAEWMTCFWKEVYREFLAGKTEIPVDFSRFSPQELADFRLYAFDLANSPASDSISWCGEGNEGFILIPEGDLSYRECALRHEKAEQMILERTEGLSADEESVRLLWDRLTAEAAYGAEGCPNSCYSLLKEGVSRCHGMAMLFTRELKALGIPSYYVLGTTGGLHAWTAFVLDGVLYAADPAYAVCRKEQGGEEKYFLSPDLLFGEDRTILALY